MSLLLRQILLRALARIGAPSASALAERAFRRRRGIVLASAGLAFAAAAGYVLLFIFGLRDRLPPAVDRIGVFNILGAVSYAGLGLAAFAVLLVFRRRRLDSGSFREDLRRSRNAILVTSVLALFSLGFGCLAWAEVNAMNRRAFALGAETHEVLSCAGAPGFAGSAAALQAAVVCARGPAAGDVEAGAFAVAVVLAWCALFLAQRGRLKATSAAARPNRRAPHEAGPSTR